MPDIMIILYHFWQARRLMHRFRTRQELEMWQQKKLASFVQNTLCLSPFYCEYANKPLAEYPIMDKSHMMAAFDAINTAGITLSDAISIAKQAEADRNFSPMINDITIGLSSGTSGKQSIFLAARNERLKWAGIMLAKALPRGLLKPHRIAFFLRANSNLYTTLNNGHYIQFEFFDLTRSIESQLKRLHDYCPTIVTAPASVLKYIAKAQQSGEIAISPLKIFSVAEVLDPIDHAYIESVFNQTAHQIYQCTEGFLGITHDDNGRLYLNEEYVHIEKEWVDKKSGRFIPIITDFSRTTQPIIRYRLDDILVEDRSDSSPFTCLNAIEGRADDICYFISPSGLKPIFADSMRQALATSHASFAEYKLIQHAPHYLEVQLSPPGDTVNRQHLIKSLRNLCENQGCIVPDIHFSLYQPPLPHQKQRRIERRFHFDQREAA